MTNSTPKSNGIGTAGFILSLIGLIMFWQPFPGWLLSLLGFILSVIGLFKSPRGLAIAGVIISTINGTIFMLMMLGIVALAVALG